jgi:hypothetical protein
VTVMSSRSSERGHREPMSFPVPGVDGGIPPVWEERRHRGRMREGGAGSLRWGVSVCESGRLKGCKSMDGFPLDKNHAFTHRSGRKHLLSRKSKASVVP